jgi:alanyl-tRNA synthetase
MLGNWSFGDYFKKEAIEWAWELVVGTWKFPPQRLYATVYCPDTTYWKRDLEEVVRLARTSLAGAQTGIIGTGKAGEALEWADDVSAFYWALHFLKADLDPMTHIVPGNRKDNFWMMGETGPCGPCSELHVDLTPAGDTNGSLVNKGDARCIEIWNLVFIQFNAVVLRTEMKEIFPGIFKEVPVETRFDPLPAKHVDTGMGFERVTSIIQGTKGLTDFAHAKISNYETDIFRPIFDKLEQLSGKRYGSTLPGSGQKEPNPASAKVSSPTADLNSGTPGLNPGAADLSGGTAKPNYGTADINRGTPDLSSGTAKAGKTAAEPNFGSAGVDSGTAGTVGTAGNPAADQIATDIAFRVIADHIRTLSFAIADGIQPGNNDRNYVLRRILRRAVRYGRTLGFKEPFFYKLVDVLADTMGDVFPEIRARKKQVQETIQREEEAFNKTLDKGLILFEFAVNTRNFVVSNIGKLSELVHRLEKNLNSLPDNFPTGNSRLKQLEVDAKELSALLKGCGDSASLLGIFTTFITTNLLIGTEQNYQHFIKHYPDILKLAKNNFNDLRLWKQDEFGGYEAFVLYDTYGFPLDLTELMARERGLTVDKVGFEKLMEEQRARARAAQKKEVISLSQIETTTPTKFVGYEALAVPAKVLEVVALKDKTAVILDTSACYAEMGGQVGDTGELTGSGQFWRVTNTQKSGNTWLHFVESGGDAPVAGSQITLTVDKSRRDAIQRHHTVTHLLHWALHEVASREASQKGSFVGPDKLTFDFNSAPLTPQQVADIEKLVNERIVENAPVSWLEVKHSHVKDRKDVMQFFGDKYGEWVRVVQIGGKPTALDGYSMELCGGTHTRATGELGLFRIVGENAIAAGVRRIEAVAGLTAYDLANQQLQLIRSLAGKINSPVHELEKKVESLLAHQKELEKSLKAAQQKEAANAANALSALSQIVQGTPAIINNLGRVDGDYLQTVVDALKGSFHGVVVLGGTANGVVALVASVSSEFTAKVQAGKIIQAIAPIVGGKGGGKPDNARGGGRDAGKLDEALAKVKTLF